MCSIDLDPCEVWRETPRKARKEHRCACCGGAVSPGTRYLDHFSVFDGYTCHSKLCAPCADDRETFGAAHDRIKPQPGYFPELLASCIADGDEESESRWRPMLDRIRARGAAAP